MSGNVFGMAMEDIAKKNHPWLRMPSGDTPGFAYNVKVHGGTPGEWTKSVIYANDLVLWMGEKVMDPFTEKILGYQRFVNYVAGTQWLVTLDPEIKTVYDLVGKKVAVGGMMQIQWGLPHYILLGDNGLGISDQMDIVYVGWKGAIAALLDGTAEVAGIGSYFNPKDPAELTVWPSKVQELIASGKTLYHIEYPKEAFDAAQANGIPIYSTTIPAGSYPFQEKDLLINIQVHQQVVKDIFPEDLAYEITKLWIDNYETFAEYHAFGKLLDPEVMSFGHTKKNTHPGAVRAFEEAGVTIPEK